MAAKKSSALGPAARGGPRPLLDELLTDDTEEARRTSAAGPPRSTNSRPPATGSVRTSVDLPEDLHERLKIATIREKTTMRQAILEGVALWLESRDR